MKRLVNLIEESFNVVFNALYNAAYSVTSPIDNYLGKMIERSTYQKARPFISKEDKSTL